MYSYRIKSRRLKLSHHLLTDILIQAEISESLKGDRVNLKIEVIAE